jgi:ParB-like chromosome segregation protein Spo0J
MLKFQQPEPQVSFKIHPAANLFPEMSDEEWKNLVADIKDNGQREPIVLFNGEVIDGRNRLRACRWLKLEPLTRVYEGQEADIVSYVLSLNLHRRHLTESQRAMVAAKLANMPKGNHSKSANLPVSPVPQSEAAKLLNVSERSVRTAKQVASKGEPEVARAVEAGNMTLNEASKVVQLRPELQKAASTMPKAERRETLAGNSLDDLQVERAATDEWGKERVGLEMALSDLCDVKGSPDELILQCPKYAAPGINKHFRQAFMKMQAFNAAYQNWEFRNVSDN